MTEAEEIAAQTDLMFNLRVAADTFRRVKSSEYREGLFNAAHANLLDEALARIAELEALLRECGDITRASERRAKPDNRPDNAATAVWPNPAKPET